MKKYIHCIVLMVLGLLAIAACKVVGLGPQVDLKGPVLTLTSPTYMQNVNEGFRVKGEVKDDQDILEVLITTDASENQWRIYNKKWEHRSSEKEGWTPFEGEGEIEIVSENHYTWWIDIALGTDADGEYTVSVVAKDKSKNTDAKSFQERTVVVDDSPPIAVLSNPLLVKDAEDLKALKLRTIQDISKLYNESIPIRWQIKEDYGLESLRIQIADGSGENIYLDKTLTYETDPVLKLNGSAEFAEEDFDKEIELDAEGKAILQIITTVTDGANNKESKSQGWFLWWPKADIPWVDVQLSEDENNPSELVVGVPITGLAYDDDGVKLVNIAIKGESDSNFGEPVSISNAGETGSFTWSYNPPSEAGKYILSIQVSDKKDTVSEAKEYYIEIIDSTMPVIELESPNIEETLFGNKGGDFNIKGFVHDDSGVDELRLVWINVEYANAAQSQLEFTNSNHAGWADTGSDAKGNKVWKLNLASSEPYGEKRFSRSFDKTLNLFSDLGVGIDSGALALKNFTFLLRAKDNSGNYKVTSLTTLGDSEGPQINITGLKRDTENKLIPLPLEEGKTLSLFEDGEKVRLSGSWSDNSLTAWKDSGNVTTRFKPSLSWGSVIPSITLHSDGTWQSASFVPPTGTVASILAEIVDIGGNKSSAVSSFIVDTGDPALIRITSAMADGFYGLGKVITIRLDFNKSVKFSGGTPSLTLNNGATAIYSSGSGTASHTFTWTVAAGRDTLDLDVSALKKNGASYEVVNSSAELSLVLPTGEFSLAGSKNIAIDTTSPKITKVSSSTAAGHYTKDKEIYFNVEMDEDLVLSGSPKLVLSTPSGAEASFVTQPNAKTLMFCYTVGSGQNGSLALNSFDLNGASITDAAGNALATTLNDVSLPTIVIDTESPAAPNVVGPVHNREYYNNVSFTLGNLESGIRYEYSLNNGSSWQAYSSEITLSNNGEYTIKGRQIDKAGNVGESPSAISITIDKGDLVQRISSSNNDGVYTTGSIPITIYLRKEVTITGTPTLKLNNGKIASYTGGTGTKEDLAFTYTIDNDASHDIARLDVTEINWDGADITIGSVSVQNEFKLPTAGSGNSLTDQRNIKIVTGSPLVKDVDLDGNVLNITFDRPIFKGSGSLTLEQLPTGYRIPIVMTEAEWENIYARASAEGQRTALNSSYTLGINGANSSGVPDTTAKYILNFDVDPDDQNLIDLFRSDEVHEHIVEVPVVSSMVSVPTTNDGKVLRIDLTGAYAPSVKGATYSVDIPKDLVQDNYGNKNQSATTYTITLAGVEAPVIRVDKQSESYKLVGGVVRATQPDTVSVKIHSRTPNTTIYYSLEGSYVALDTMLQGGSNATDTPRIRDINAGTYTTKPVAKTNRTTINDLATNKQYTSAFDIGDATYYDRGLKYIIKAGTTSNSFTSYETAFRSVLVFNDANEQIIQNLDGYSNVANVVEQPWIRGGDSITGSTMTPGFPLSWDETDYSGVRLLSNHLGRVWYWSSWEVSVPAFLRPLLGSTPTDIEDARDNGPLVWGWGKNAWIPFAEYYPLFPGESRELRTGQFNDLSNPTRGTFKFGRNGDGGVNPR